MFIHYNFILMRIFLAGTILLLFGSTSSLTYENHNTCEAETAKAIGGASKAADSKASKGYVVSLSGSGQAVEFTNLPRSRKLAILGYDVPLTFVQDDKGLTVKPGEPIQSLQGTSNQSLASRCRVLRITHDKGWFNDDDPGATYPGWIRNCNLGTGDYNNDLTVSETPGDIWSCSFTGSSVIVIAPKENGAGKVEIQIDGTIHPSIDLSTQGTLQAQQNVYEVTALTPGQHNIKIVNRGPGPVALDALIVL